MVVFLKPTCVHPKMNSIVGAPHGEDGSPKFVHWRIGSAAVDGANPDRRYLVEPRFVFHRIKHHLGGLVQPYQNYNPLSLGIGIIPCRP